MAALIKPIEATSVHQIQSGQVIVDLCSVVKELVENSLDAEANNIEVRFKNYGLDSIEVHDNGSGISEDNYANLALKHYTSKLSTYDDLSQLNTFGFRGEALSSLCALSTLSVITAQAHEVPCGKRLEFEISGVLKGATVTAAQKGTTVVVENLFEKLPVRQKELSKNIKREYGKVLGILQAYACISTHVKFVVKHAASKGNSSVVFSTQGNATTRDNIANVYGAKTLPQLIELDLNFDFQSTSTPFGRDDTECPKVNVVGHISRPVFGEGRQTPDRQMFFVNGRPCGLPQIAKAINEVYKMYNVSQSPFIFADFRMDTNSYDVNVSPDKRTILLHNATALTDKIKEELTGRFDSTEQTVPQFQGRGVKLTPYRQLTVSRHSSREESIAASPTPKNPGSPSSDLVKDAGPVFHDLEAAEPTNSLKSHFSNIASIREAKPRSQTIPNSKELQERREKQIEKVAKSLVGREQFRADRGECDDMDDSNEVVDATQEDTDVVSLHVRDFNARMRELQQMPSASRNRRNEQIESASSTDRIGMKGPIEDTFSRVRARRLSPELATITIGDRTVTRLIGVPSRDSGAASDKKPAARDSPITQFSQSLKKFEIEDHPTTTAHATNIRDEGLDSSVSMDEHRMQQLPLALSVAAQENSDDDGENRSPEVEVGKSDVEAHVSRSMVEARNSSTLIQEADRTQEEYRVAELIRFAETTGHVSSKECQRRNVEALKIGSTKTATTKLVAVYGIDIDGIREWATAYGSSLSPLASISRGSSREESENGGDEEQRLTLTIAKSDFANMHIAGQFNLGFIIASRPKDLSDSARKKDELFIIDQHASDEKYNFERLQAETVVSNQRLATPISLDLTAVEEEIVLENESALRQNGFIIEADTTGSVPVGRRCRLLSLPQSREITFNTNDLEELIHLLSEAHISSDSTFIPRPDKVRKMFAMRACRSSIMIGKTLSMRQMKSVLEHMGTIDKPWNCPHGRPTMRHLTSLDDIDKVLWSEGNGIVSGEDLTAERNYITNIWQKYSD